MNILSIAIFLLPLLWILANCTIWACQSLWKRLSLYLLFPVQHLCQRWGSHMLVDVRAAFVDRKAPDQAMKPFHLCRGSELILTLARGSRPWDGGIFWPPVHCGRERGTSWTVHYTPFQCTFAHSPQTGSCPLKNLYINCLKVIERKKTKLLN